MNVYLAHLEFEKAVSALDLLSDVSDWYGRKVHQHLDPPKLITASNLEFRHEHNKVQVLASGGSTPDYVALRLTHPDSSVQGRGWIADTTLSFPRDERGAVVSVHLHTVEAGVLVSEAPRTTRPAFVGKLVDRFATTPMPGRRLIRLDNEADTVARYEALVNDPERQFPVVVVSPAAEGYLVDPNRAHHNLQGIAQVVAIPPGVDTYRLADQIGRANVPYAGAVFLLPGDPRLARRGLLPDLLRIDRDRGVDLDDRLFAEVISRTNLRNLRSHISPERVREERLRHRLAELMQSSTRSDELLLVEELYDERITELAGELDDAKAESLGHLQDALTQSDEIEALQQRIYKLESKLASIATSPGASTEGHLAAVRDVLVEVMNQRRGRPTLAAVLEAVDTLFPDRVVVLESAKRSARKSRFAETDVALDLLLTLCDDAFEEYAGGAGDAGVRSIFGESFASDESETVKSHKSARERRSFHYRGESCYMGRHLKHGIKDSDATTLRVHFHWDTERKRIVVGHCGQHLDFH